MTLLVRDFNSDVSPIIDRETWLQERQKGIGSSEAAAAIGMSPWETPLSLYLRKIGAAEPVIENEAMRWGLRLEPLIAEAYAEQTGIGFGGFESEQVFRRSKTNPWMVATIDRFRTDGRIVELKAVGLRQASQWGESGSDEVPGYYTCQVLHQLAVVDGDVADVAALIGGQELRVYTIERDDDVLSAIVEREAEFWDRVQRREPPEVNTERDGRLLSRLFPEAVGEIVAGPELSAKIREWEMLGATEKTAEKAREMLKAEILVAMGTAGAARLEDGRTITRKVIRIKESTVTRKAYDRVDLRVKGESNG